MRKLPILVLLLFCVQIASAQKMSDDQVIEYVMEAREKGDSQQQIAKDLLRIIGTPGRDRRAKA